MNFLNLVRNRQSVRQYSNKPVEREKIERCLEAARLAPSASNRQPWEFIVIDNPQVKEAVAGKTFSKLIFFNRFSLQAPILIVIISERESMINKIGKRLKDKPFTLIDIGIAAENICLQATESGLGTCILGWFDEKGVKEVLAIPQSNRIELIITMGYPESEVIRPKKRKELDQIRSYNQYKLKK